MSTRWEQWSSEELLDLRLCDLGLSIDGTWLEPLIAKVFDELADRGLCFRPKFWLADEWFAPDGVPGVGVPFYLADKRLMRLEKSQMYEVEGGTRSECLKLMRHEIGHTIDTAYGLRRRKRWRELFGSPAETYPDYYRPKPSSKRYVQHLAGWYAQSHPTEDFAETFAVWLTPRSRWRQTYAGWSVLRKLHYVDEVMHEIADTPPRVRSQARPYSLAKLRHTLRSHYIKKRTHYDVGYSEVYDHELMRLFREDGDLETAASVLRRRRRRIRELVATWTGTHEFTVDQVLKEIVGRCRELGLRLRGSEQQATHEFTLMLAVHTTHQLHRGGGWHRM